MLQNVYWFGLLRKFLFCTSNLHKLKISVNFMTNLILGVIARSFKAIDNDSIEGKRSDVFQLIKFRTLYSFIINITTIL